MQDVASKNAYFFRTRSEGKSNLLNRQNTFSFINLLADKIYLKTEKIHKDRNLCGFLGMRWQKRYPLKMKIPGPDLIFFHFYIAIFRFLLLDVPLLKKRVATKTWFGSSVLWVEKEAEIWMSHFWVLNFDLCSKNNCDRMSEK